MAETRTAEVLTDDEFDRLVGAEPVGARDMTVLTPARAEGRPPAVVRRDVPHLEAWARDETYREISARPVSETQAAALCDPLKDEEVDIKPDSFGAVYLSHSGYRRRLNLAFRPGGWALRRLTPYVFEAAQGIAYAEFALYAEGRFVGMATGEMRLPDNNDDMTKGDIIEGLKSNALMRCCKDLGMAMECWDLKWTENFRNRLCVRVWVRIKNDSKPRWRRLDARPFFNETGILADSPNRDKYHQAKAESDKQASHTAQAASLDGVDDELKASIEKAFMLCGLAPAVRFAKLNEFLGGQLDPSQKATGVRKLYEWCKDEYARQQGRVRVSKDDNSKKSQAPAGEVVTSSGNPAGTLATSPASTAVDPKRGGSDARGAGPEAPSRGTGQVAPATTTPLSADELRFGF